MPYTGVTAVCASRYAVTTQEMWLRPPRSPTIVGSAVETIVWSSDAISSTSISPVKTTQTLAAALGDRLGCRGGGHSNSPPAGSSRRSADRCASAVSVQTTSASPAVAAPSTQTPLQPLLA